MATLPYPIKTWHQYGEIIGHWSKQQMIEYGQECASEARAESMNTGESHKDDPAACLYQSERDGHWYASNAEEFMKLRNAIPLFIKIAK